MINALPNPTMNLQTLGLHHITAITSNASKAVSFYTKTLGLRLVKKTVNFDDPSAYHLYFGDEKGKPGTLLTFFDWGKSQGYGHVGAGVVHHLSFTTTDTNSLTGWKIWLLENGVDVLGPFERGSFNSLYFRDPDGLILEISTPGRAIEYSDVSKSELQLGFGNQTKNPTQQTSNHREIPSELKLHGLHHVTAITHGSTRTHGFFTGTLNMDELRDNRGGSHGSVQRIFGHEASQQGSMISFIESPAAPHGSVGIGTVHHIAFAVKDDVAQQEWRQYLLDQGVHVTPVMDRKYFKSIYFREPNGILLELATVPPGFAVDEPVESLGQKLALPSWLEPKRRSIEISLDPISLAA